MMKTIPGIVLMLVSATTANAQPSSSAPTTPSAEVMQCAQAQMVVDHLLSTATMRLETARQANSAAEMRAAIDALQATIRDVRAQLAPCASVKPPDGVHAGHTMPAATAPAPATSRPAAATPMAPAPTAPPVARPPTPDPHAGHATTTPKPPPTPAPRTRVTPAAKPAPADPHAGHGAMPPAKPAAPAAKPAGKPPSSQRPAAPQAGRSTASTPAAPSGGTAAAEVEPAIDPVCGLKVDPASAPKADHQGRTYYFCSEQHQQLFQKNPPKYLPKR